MTDMRPLGTETNTPYNASLAQAISDRALHLIIMPTEQCNFRCTYCYESFKIGRMPRHVLQSLLRFIRNRAAELDFLDVSWFGGEPLMALDLMEEISEEILRLCREYPPLHYRAEATTNAFFLTPETFPRLLRWGIRGYQISFDGLPEHHDAKRILANGRGTFHRLWSNLRGMRESAEGFAVTVRLHIDRDNFRQIPSFISMFKADFGNDPRFTLYIRELSQLADPLKAPLNVFELREAESVLQDALRCAESEGVRIRLPERKAHVCSAACYAARLNSFVIRADGRIGKCTVALDSKVNDVGILMPDGTLDLNRHRLLLWTRGLGSGDAVELGCPMIDIHKAAPRWARERPHPVLKGTEMGENLRRLQSAGGVP